MNRLAIMIYKAIILLSCYLKNYIRKLRENLGECEKGNICCLELHMYLKGEHFGAYEKGNTCCL